jgi:hypothetical protein
MAASSDDGVQAAIIAANGNRTRTIAHSVAGARTAGSKGKKPVFKYYPNDA